jgi:hypothetical protein
VVFFLGAGWPRMPIAASRAALRSFKGERLDREGSMTLHVALRDGFQNDTVTIKVNGREAYRRSGVTTNLTISYADAVDVPVEGSRATVEVAVDGGQTGSEEVRVVETPFVDVRILEGTMEFLKSKEPIPML